MHHENETSDEMNDALKDAISEYQQLDTQLKLGATGKFPGGKLTENDEGELAFAVMDFRGKVVINFGSPVASLGMSPEEARALADSLRERADMAELAG